MPSSIVEKAKVWGPWVLAAVLFIALVVGIVLFYQYQEQLAIETLQGCWHLYDDMFLIFDDHTMQVLRALPSGGYQNVYSDKSIRYDYRKWHTTIAHKHKAHRCRVKRSKTQPIKGLCESQMMTLDVYPVLGTIVVIDNGKETSRLIKDNAMSLAYLS